MKKRNKIKYRIKEHGGKPCSDCGALYHYPSKYLMRSIKRSHQNQKEGMVSPVFSNVKDMFKWFNNDHAKLQNGECVCHNKFCTKH